MLNMFSFNLFPQTPCPPPRQNIYSCNTQTNCPNCGAPIDRSGCECPYCGTPYIDSSDSVEKLREALVQYDYNNQMVMMFKDGAMRWVRSNDISKDLPKPIPTITTY